MYAQEVPLHPDKLQCGEGLISNRGHSPQLCLENQFVSHVPDAMLNTDLTLGYLEISSVFITTTEFQSYLPPCTYDHQLPLDCEEKKRTHTSSSPSA